MFSLFLVLDLNIILVRVKPYLIWLGMKHIYLIGSYRSDFLSFKMWTLVLKIKLVGNVHMQLSVNI